MGRRGTMRGRSGILFVTFFAIGLVIFYLSWKSLYSNEPNPKRSDNDHSPGLIYKMQVGIDSREVLGEQPDRGIDYQEDNKISHKPSKNNLSLEKLKNQESFEKIVAIEKQRDKLNTKKYYKSFENMSKTVKAMTKLVHLDLKGAAPNLSYLKKIIPLMSKLGATGLLIEYEDMFPYSGSLKNISAINSYTMDEIRDILAIAKNYSLAVIPLIQTFGHMEFVLKNTYENLRESSYTPQVIDITSDRSYELIREMIKQILEAHPDAAHLHIGCDEVYELGRGKSSLLKKMDKDDLFLRHVTKVANMVKDFRNKTRGNIVPIIWDDELRSIDNNKILLFKLPDLVEIMVWYYGVNVLDRIEMPIWDKYSQLFKSVWIASAYKGATGSRQFYTEPWFHLQNHFSWLEVISLNSRRLSFRGIALTGWSRYDHFATLCELLPVSLPSLAVCLATMNNSGFTENAHKLVSKYLQCSNLIEIDFPEIDKKKQTAVVSQDCRFPGFSFYHAMQEFYGYTKIHTNYEGWLSDYQISNQFSNPGKISSLIKQLTLQYSGFSRLSNPIKQALTEIYSQDTVDEWMAENIEERLSAIKNILTKTEILLKPTAWPRRPLLSSRSNFSAFVGDSSNVKDQLTRDVKEQSNDKQPFERSSDKKSKIQSIQNNLKNVMLPTNSINSVKIVKSEGNNTMIAIQDSSRDVKEETPVTKKTDQSTEGKMKTKKRKSKKTVRDEVTSKRNF